MKKLIFLFALVAFAFTANAQVVVMKATTGNSSDTVTNTATETLSAQLNGSFDVVTVQLTVTKISGTVGGTAILQASLDGTTWTTLNTAAIPQNNDTITLTNVTTNSCFWVIEPSKYLYYRVSVTGTGTMAARVAAKLLSRKP
jgi:hypothetical protein